MGAACGLIRFLVIVFLIIKLSPGLPPRVLMRSMVPGVPPSVAGAFLGSFLRSLGNQLPQSKRCLLALRMMPLSVSTFLS